MSTSAVRSLESWRSEFPVLANSVYFLNNAMGAAPLGLKAKLEQYAEEQWRLGDQGWKVWWPWVLAHGDRIARQINAPAGSVILDVGVTALVHRFASGVDFKGDRRRVVTSALDFPSVGYAWQGWQRHGAEIVVVPSPDGIVVDEEALIAAIDERTAVVSLSLATYCSGALVDVSRVAQKAHAMGAIVLVDAFQAYGIVPIDVEQLGADVLVSGTRKFALGAGESAFMYVRPSIASKLQPMLNGWFAHRDPFAFAAEFEMAADTQRFMGGTPTVLPHYAASAGLDVIEAVGIDRIRSRSLALTSRIIMQADEQGLGLVTPRADAERAGVVCLKFPLSAEVAERLNASGFSCSHRPTSGLRLGPHFFNLDSEVDQFMAALAAARRELPAE
jgi:kynureninase